MNDGDEISWHEQGADAPAWYLSTLAASLVVVAAGIVWLLALGGVTR